MLFREERMGHLPFTQKENKDRVRGLLSLRNERGWPTLRGSRRQILEYVASFPYDAGCFAGMKRLSADLGICKRTVSRGLKYLVGTGFLRVGEIKSKRAYFLGEGSPLAPMMSRGKQVKEQEEKPVSVIQPKPDPKANPKTKQDEDWAEILLPTKKRGKKADKQQRAEEARDKISKGHIANPLGIVDNRPRRLCPSLARDVPPEQVSTVPQLYKFLIKAYSEVFGDATIEDMMPQDKGAIASQFAILSQKFVDHCNYEPKKSDLAEYFKWLLEPSRVQSIITASDKFKGRKQGLITWQQMTGALYVKRFYDEVLAKRVDAPPPSSVVSPKPESASSKIRKLYERLALNESSPTGMMIAMVPIGYVISTQYFYDEKGFDKEESRKALLGLMSRFISVSPNKTAAVEYLQKMSYFTKQNMGSCDSRCVWYDWAPLEGLVEEAERKAEGGQDGKDGIPPDGSRPGVV